MHHFSPVGYSKKFRQGCLCYFFGLKFDKLLFFGVAQNESYFWGVEKNKDYFLGSLHYFFGLLKK